MDRLDIINLALIKCGLPPACALNDCDWNADFVFDQCASECLRAYAWGFAQEYRTLERLADDPQFGFNYCYAMPENCLRVIDVHSAHDLRAPRARFRTRGRQVLTNASPCYARYIAALYEPMDWPPDFRNAVACRIAAEIAARSAQNTQMATQLLQIWQLALNAAQLNDARENTERVQLEPSLIEQRNMTSGRNG